MPQDNKRLVRRFFDEILSGQNQATVAAIVAEDFVGHHPQFPQGIRGRDGLLQIVTTFHVAFPDLSYRVEELIEEGALVAARWSASGTHRGPLLSVPPTGRTGSISGIDLFRLEAGRCAEMWTSSDFLGLLQQLGVVPPLQ